MSTVSISSDPFRFLLVNYIKGRTFYVQGCEQYMKDKKLKYDGMPTTVEIDYGGSK